MWKEYVFFYVYMWISVSGNNVMIKKNIDGGSFLSSYNIVQWRGSNSVPPGLACLSRHVWKVRNNPSWCNPNISILYFGFTNENLYFQYFAVKIDKIAPIKAWNSYIKEVLNFNKVSSLIDSRPSPMER